jgi:menaquinone-specific isochorismate synthase
VTLASIESNAVGIASREAERLLDVASSEPGQFVRVAIPVPAVALAPLCTLGESAFLWEPLESPAFVGIDQVKRYQASGATRFSEIQRAVSADLGDSDPALRVFGGFAFEAGTAGDAFERFGDASFVLPRFCYERGSANGTLSLVLSRRELAQRERATEWCQQLLSLGQRLGELPGATGTRLHPVRVRDVSADAWADLVADILARIDSGSASKIVAARRVEFDFERPLHVAATLRALLDQARGSTCFAFRHGSSAFLGATPERLVKKQGNRVESEALAGTFRTAGSPLAAELLRSPKEHSEHMPVLAAIVSALEPLCSELHHPAHPEMRELPDLLHLRTPISGTLREPGHVLELVQRLHPTPAVGGVPTDVALNWIREREPGERGWYAGPVGWFDGQGDGDFQVALRSGLLEGTRATLFAGGGIVRGSEPPSEYAETELKLRALFGALRCA